MESYHMTLEYLLQLPQFVEWPELQTLMQRLAKRQPIHWRLPLSTCCAVGGTEEDAIPAMAAIACLHTSLKLVDDLLDNDPEGEYHMIGEAATANFALALLTIGLEALAICSQSVDRRLAMMKAYAHVATKTALGQHWDVQGINSEDQYWQVVRYKGGPFFGLAFALGAWLGNAPAEKGAKFQTLGCYYGTMIQLHDDLSDSMAVPANPDWAPGRATLPMLFAQLVPHDNQQQFVALRTAIPDPTALAEAQEILLRCGAVSYTVEQILHTYQAAQKLLEEMHEPNRQPLDILLADVIKPVGELLTLAGVAEVEAIQIMCQS